MKKFSRSHHGSLNELNITPLLDLAFVLLVIFIITTPQLVNNLELNLPAGQPPVQSDKPKINRIVVNAAGKISWNDQAMDLATLRHALEQMKTNEPEAAVVVKGADETDYQNIVNVFDVIQQLDITKVGLATETADSSPTP